ncbi:MAG TPA: HAD-IIIA family hydrolase [Candidatus Ozemobacteraceae bacterium]|nr:HAD-IIIA family hydrolase [Candidatus Ozemobacteraceae bacterium]
MKLLLPVLLATVFFSLFEPQQINAEAPDQPTLKRRQISPLFIPPASPTLRIAFFDADSTLRIAPSGSPSANHATDVALLPLLTGPLQKLASEGYLIAIVSNQAGVAHGHVTLQNADAALAYTVERLASIGAPIHYYDFAELENEDRKPDIGMARRLADLASTTWNKTIDWQNSLMVGDSAWKEGKDLEPDGTPGDDFSNSDRLFAENLQKTFGGTTFHHPRDFFGWKAHGVRNFKSHQDLQNFIAKHPELAPR